MGLLWNSASSLPSILMSLSVLMGGDQPPREPRVGYIGGLGGGGDQPPSLLAPLGNPRDARVRAGGPKAQAATRNLIAFYGSLCHSGGHAHSSVTSLDINDYHEIDISQSSSVNSHNVYISNCGHIACSMSHIPFHLFDNLKKHPHEVEHFFGSLWHNPDKYMFFPFLRNSKATNLSNEMACR